METPNPYPFLMGITDERNVIWKPLKKPTCLEVIQKFAWLCFRWAVYVGLVVMAFWLGWTMGAVYG